MVTPMGGDNSLVQDPRGRFPALPASGLAGNRVFVAKRAEPKSDPLVTPPMPPLRNCFPTLDIWQYVVIGKFCFWRFFILRHLVFSGTGKKSISLFCSH